MPTFVFTQYVWRGVEERRELTVDDATADCIVDLLQYVITPALERGERIPATVVGADYLKHKCLDYARANGWIVKILELECVGGSLIFAAAEMRKTTPPGVYVTIRTGDV